MTLEELIDGGETLEVEFKRKQSDRELVETAVCMANGQGGTILLGVDDDGVVVGAEPRHSSRAHPHSVGVMIQNHTDPPLPVSSRVEAVRGHDLLVVEVPRADPGPVGTRKGVYLKRVVGPDGKPACAPLSPQELVSRAYITRGIDYATSPAQGATMADLNPKEFDRFRRMCGTSSGDSVLAGLSDEEICRALGLIPQNHPVSLGMILLFGREEALEHWTPTAEVLLQDLRSGPNSTNESLRLPLLHVAEEVHGRLDRRNSTTEVVVGLTRVDIPLISKLTLRESIANALVHRDYSEQGPTQIQLTETEFSVGNPGGFPPGVTISNILEQSRPRSIALTHAFMRAGLVERKGKGVNEMFESQLRAGREAPDYSGSTDESVLVSVPLSTVDLELVRFLAALQSEKQRDLSLSELRVIHEIKMSGSATSAELAEYLSLTAARARSVANSLVATGFLEARGNGRSRRFHLTARFYDLAQDRAAYVRVRPIEPMQQEQMVLDYVESFGKITRSQAAELCQLAPTEASNLLKRLRDRSKLVLKGQRRGSHYVLPE